MAPAARQRLISASDLKRQRGWTEGLLTGLLGAPDAHCPNPHGYRSPMRLFREDRVLDAECQLPFLARVEELDERMRWRREQPTRVLRAAEVDHLEWLDDPWRIALFHLPRRPRVRRRRRAPEPVKVPAPAMRFEVLRLF